MLKRIKSLIISLALASGVFVPIAVPAVVMAQAATPTDGNIQGSLCAGSQLTFDETSDCTTGVDAQEKVNDLIIDIINIFSVIVGVVSVIMIIIGGLKYITSGGDSGNVTGAKNTILYAIIGLVVVALAQIIVKFVLSKINTTING